MLEGCLLTPAHNKKLNEFAAQVMEQYSRPRLVLDLSQLKYMNSEGLSALLKVLTRVRLKGGDMVLTGIHGTLEEIFLITRLTHIFRIYSNRSEAVEDLNRSFPDRESTS